MSNGLIRRGAIAAVLLLTGGVVAQLATGGASTSPGPEICVSTDGVNAQVIACPTTTTQSTTTTTGPNVTTTTSAPSTTVSAPTTTTQPTTTTVGGSVGSGPPAAGGYFTLSPPGTPFRSDSQCDALVHRSTWEPRPTNTTANHTQVTNTLAYFSQWSSTWNSTYRPRIDGNFHGTTDEIIQWAACKWGLNDDWVRAEAVSESSWFQSTVGDNGTSYGLLQIRYLYHPNVNGTMCKSCVGSSWPNSQNSTAWNVDQFGAEIRGCYDGMSTYLGNTRGDMAGCIQSWFSGAWTPGGGSYYQGVLGHYNAKPWLSWAG